MGTNRPLITIQCGNYANYVGAHFWNIQEAGFQYQSGSAVGGILSEEPRVDHDVLYREGLTIDKQVTYTPRLIAVDLKGSLGSLPLLGDLYEKPGIPKLSSLSWKGETKVMKEEPRRKNSFLRELGGEEEEETYEKDADDTVIRSQESRETPLYNLDNEVEYWSDYLYGRFHPRSVLLLESYQAASQLHPFDMFGLGEAVWTESHQSLGDEMEDRIRCFAEECDNLQGFHVITDSHNGFGGLCCRLVDLLSDEYSSKSVVSVAVSPPGLPADYTFTSCGGRLAGSLLTLAGLLAGSSLTLPLTLATQWFPLRGQTRRFTHLHYQPDLDYHTAAILAAALDTATLAYRGRDQLMGMSDVISGLTGGDQRRLASLSMAFPFNFTGPEAVEASLLSSLTSLCPGPDNYTHSIKPYSSVFTCRGFHPAALFSQRSGTFSACQTSADYVATCVRQQSPACSPAVVFHTRPLPTGRPFPHLFTPDVGSTGHIAANYKRPSNRGVEFVSQVTALDSGATVAESVKLLAGQASRLKVNKLPRVLESGTEEDDWREAVERVSSAADLLAQP